jgi:hypothetical protein
MHGAESKPQRAIDPPEHYERTATKLAALIVAALAGGKSDVKAKGRSGFGPVVRP